MDGRALEIPSVWQEEDGEEGSFGNKPGFDREWKTVDIKGRWQRVE